MTIRAAILNYFSPERPSAKHIREEGLTLDPEFVERVLNPKPPSDWERRQAAISAQVLEDDRELTRGR